MPISPGVAVSRPARLALLLNSQNKDGGWGYFPGRRSSLEPTAYALLALQGAQADTALLARGLRLLTSWQRPDGAWRASADVPDPHWATSLCVTLHCVRRTPGPALHRGVQWLLGLSGAENSWMMRAFQLFHPGVNELDFSLKGWPWRPDNASWVEPTAQALLALKRAAPFVPSQSLRSRVQEGERLLWDRRCSDGGWNVGTKKVLGELVPGYPETTALALLGLQGASEGQVQSGLQLVERWQRKSQSPWAQAWMTICLRSYGQPVSPAANGVEGAPEDVLLAALQCLADPDGGHQFFQVGALS